MKIIFSHWGLLVLDVAGSLASLWSAYKYVATDIQAKLNIRGFKNGTF